MTHIKIYVPTTNLNIIYDIAKKFSDIFGGCTIIPNCKGYWKNYNKNKYEVDNITIIESYTNYEPPAFDVEVRAICAKLRDNLKQKCVACTIDNEIFLI